MASRNSGSGDSKEDTRERAPAAVDEFSELFLPGQTSASLADRRQHQPAVEHGESSGAHLYGMPQSIPTQGHSSNVLPPLSYQMESSKKPRTQFTPKQLCHLEELFEKNRFPSSKERGAIAKELNLTLNHIQIWFQNRRAKFRRKKKKHKAEGELSKVPRPPPFWPANLPFDSNIAQTQELEAVADPELPLKKSKKTKAAARSTSSKDRKGSHSPGVPATSSFSPSSSVSTPPSLPSRPGSSKKVPSLPHSQKEGMSPSSLDVSIPPSHSIEQPPLPVEGPYTREMSQLQSFLESPGSTMSPPIFAESPVLLYDILEDIPELPLHEGYMPGMEIQPQAYPSLQHQMHPRPPPIPSYPQHHFAPPPHYYNPAFDISYLPSSSYSPQTTMSQQTLHVPPNQSPFSTTQGYSDRFPHQMPLPPTSQYEHFNTESAQYRETCTLPLQLGQSLPLEASNVPSSHMPKTTRPLGL